MSEPSPNAAIWEAAYERFETPAQERKKFVDRLLRLGASDWPKDASLVELFCGRGNGMTALASLGFTAIEGVDLSAELLARYDGPHKTFHADCRRLPFSDHSRDILIVQGGLHHLPTLPDDLAQTLGEVRRVLKPRGRFVVVEPWKTFFLDNVHRIAKNPLARRLSSKVDALQTMIENEQRTYDNWLSRPEEILGLFETYFTTEQRRVGWGKLEYVGRTSA